ncbi:MAG: N-methyl-L-tryptophan oxidase [Phototrophicales bacterium]|nr:MAG: N-methyl-L-tryptophan oxidase [Phototrophicales bacterium]
MTTSYDLIIVGAGAMGSAAAYHAAKQGAKVLLLERYDIDHQMGSSYGQSRIIRYAYDHTAYIPLARAAYQDWAALEAEAGEILYVKTGGIDFAHPGEPVFQKIVDTLHTTGIDHEMLTADEAMARFPQWRFDPDMVVLYQADAGLMRASKCVLAQVRLARERGAGVLEQTVVTHVAPSGDGVTVTTTNATYSASRVILSAGAWMRPLVSALGVDLPLQPLRSHEIYFHPSDPAMYTPERFPTYIGHLYREFGAATYGIGNVGRAGVKIGLHGGVNIDDPTIASREPDLSVIEAMERFAARYLPGQWTRASARVCLYTMTPDEHFIIDRHPEHAQIVIASPCSGHGFKFSTTIGRILSDLALKGESPMDIGFFRLSRFAAEKAGS